ncbi:hypothetical protein D3C72_2222790 [compost metagenome]
MLPNFSLRKKYGAAGIRKRIGLPGTEWSISAHICVYFSMFVSRNAALNVT